MGEFFTSFDDAWSDFLVREEPLESFFDEFPDDPELFAEEWLIVPPPEVKRRALLLQGELEDVPGLVLSPHHYLHVSLPGLDLDGLFALGPFELEFRRVNVFHDGVVVEAVSDLLGGVSAPPTFLPHMTVAVVQGAPEVEPVRSAVLPLRETVLGTASVAELVKVRVPAGRTTMLQPWTVVDRVPLRR